MHKNETSHPIGFSSEKITLFAPPPSLFAPFSPPFSRQNPIIAHRNAKTPLLFRESPRLLLKTPKLFPIPAAFCPSLTRARSFIYEIIFHRESFLDKHFVISILFVLLPKGMSLHRTTNGQKSCFRTGKRQKVKPYPHFPSAQKTRRRP